MLRKTVLTWCLTALVLSVMPWRALSATTVPLTDETTFTTTPSEMTTQPEADTTTTESDTTTPASTNPTTQPASTQPTTPNAPLEPFVVRGEDNKVCVVIKGIFQFNIDYTANDGFGVQTKTRPFLVPTDGSASVRGTCDNDTDVVEIGFNRGWKMLINIASDPVAISDSLLISLEAEDVIYHWRKVSLTYTLDPNLFPDASDPSEDPIQVTSELPEETFKGSSVGSYRCDSQQTVVFEQPGVTMDISSLQYRAFGDDESETFPDDNVAQCPGPQNDDDDDNTVAIVLGSVFGTIGLILIVGFTVYCLKRRRSSYEAV